MQTLREWLSSGPYTLTMSSGFFGFYAHAGVLSVLEEEDLVPASVTGSSAGALVGGLWAAGVSSNRLVAVLSDVDRSAFWDPGIGLGLLKGQLFAELLHRILPVRTFTECRVPVRISVFDAFTLRTRSVDSGDLATAIRASCAVPGLFHPVWHARRPLYDGGVLDRPGLCGVPDGERVFYHHLTSRVPLASALPVLGRGIPTRRDMFTFVVDGLPRCDPFHLENGRRAIDTASAGLRLALERPFAAP
jgi:NTE family protein